MWHNINSIRASYEKNSILLYDEIWQAILAFGRYDELVAWKLVSQKFMSLGKVLRPESRLLAVYPTSLVALGTVSAKSNNPIYEKETPHHQPSRLFSRQFVPAPKIPKAKSLKKSKQQRGIKRRQSWCSSSTVGAWSQDLTSRTVYLSNWEGDCVLEYRINHSNDLEFVRVFASDPALRNPEGMCFWKGKLYVSSSFHSTIVALGHDGAVLDSKKNTIRLAAIDWIWGLAVMPTTDTLLVSVSPPYDFQHELPGAVVSKRGRLLECDANGQVIPVVTGLTRPGGISVAPKSHPCFAGHVFITQYGTDDQSAGVISRLSRPTNAPFGTPFTECTLFIDMAAFLCSRQMDPGLVNPWAITFSATGDSLFLCTDPNDNRLLKFDAHGSFLDTLLHANGQTPNFLCCI